MIGTIKLDHCSKSCACEVHLNESYPTHVLSLYVCSLVDHEFGTHVLLSPLLVIGEIFEHCLAL